MRKIVVASHSLLAQGFKDTLEFLTGKSDAVNAVCAYVNDNGEGLDAAVEAALSGTDEVVVLTDALGGSVNQRFSRFASDRIHVIAGVNEHLHVAQYPAHREVVAEGVQDRDALQLLEMLGCDMAQGFFISRPLTAEKLEHWLQTSPWGLRTKTARAEIVSIHKPG